MRYVMTEKLSPLLVRPAARESTAVLDGFRAAAFAWIFQVHSVAILFLFAPVTQLQDYFSSEPWYPEVVLRGHHAVDVFNVLSAYLMADTLFRVYRKTGTIDAASYVRSRVLRILPFYYFFLSLCVAIHLFIERIPHADNAWTNYLFLNNYVPFQDNFLNHTWTQALEIQFGVIFPFLLASWLKPGARVPSADGETVHDKRNGVANTSREQTSWGLFRWLLWLLLASLVCRAIGVLIIHFLTADGLQLPVHIHTVDWITSKLDRSTIQFYRFLYLPLFTRFAAFVCGVLVAWARHHPLQSETTTAATADRPHTAGVAHMLPSSNLRVVLCVAIMLLCMMPRLTSHSLDPYYAVLPTAIWLVVFRLCFAVPFACILYWCLEYADSASRIGAATASLSSHGDSTAAPVLITVILRIFSHPWWFPLSTVSYVAYMLHVLVIGGVHGALAPFWTSLQLPLTTPVVMLVSLFEFAITLAVSVPLYLYVEKPLQDWRSRVAQSERSKVAVAPTPVPPAAAKRKQRSD